MIPVCILAMSDEGNREFMIALYINYERLMYSTIDKILHDQWGTEDVLQSTLLKLIDKVSLLRKLSKPQLANYIVVSCKNTAINEMRFRAKRRTSAYNDLVVDNFEVHDSAEDTVIQMENCKELCDVWERLDDRSRYLLEARYILEEMPEEIAKNLGIKPESVRMALTRAKRKASKLMAER